jgi:hypothetical protein
MFETDSIDETDIMNTIHSTTPNTNSLDLAEYRQWRDSKIRDAGIAEGMTRASKEQLAQESAADAAALARLTNKGITLKDAFGACSTTPGRNLLVNLSRSSFANQNGLYRRLRRMAAEQNLVK